MTSDYYSQYNAIQDAFASKKDLADVLRILEFHFSNEGVNFKIIDDSDFPLWRIYNLEPKPAEFPTFAHAFDYLIIEAIKRLKAKREIPTE